ncbi:MAG: S26 family signal peptidase [Brevundimonas sp.]|uniref:S26 family signal peptidase n=1 Tax=Brevundimonas sp. TaxID=1871086 RepID=UPI0039189701
MASPLDNGSRWSTLAVTLFALGVLGLAAGQAPALALINESPSLPRGLYARASGAPDLGVIVAVAPPAGAAAYLAGLGAAPDVLLLKRVRAGAGDMVCSEGDLVWTPAGALPVSERDRRGASLPQWRDCRALEGDEVFLTGDTPTSFDSRYFGPVRTDRLRGVYREVVSW